LNEIKARAEWRWRGVRQTSSGKTHTMQGKLGNKDDLGIMPRAFDLIFSAIKDCTTDEEFVVKVR
jgi:hypothetical protein